MSLILTGSVAALYAAGVVTVHRVSVARKRALAAHFPPLAWLDWDTLFSTVLAAPAQLEREARVTSLQGGPSPVSLRRPASDELKLLESLVAGARIVPNEFERGSWSGGEARWLSLLARIHHEPMAALHQLESSVCSTVPEVYLLEWLLLEHRVTAVNLEWAAFGAKLRINQALRRFGDHASLYFLRARASSLLGFTESVLNDLARAVYFSRQAAFYLHAVTQMSFIQEARPSLFRACREALKFEGAGT